MRHFRFLIWACAAVSALAGVTGQAKAPAAAYQGVIAIDAASGQVLFEDHADVVTPPASMTKLMTFAVLHDKLASGALALETAITVTAEDANIGGTQVYLKQGETFSVEELIYAMMIQSANDAAHALGRTAGGSVPAFVALMNEKAKSLGMTQSTFRTPHGLPPSNRRVSEGDLSSPRDYATLCRYLVAQTDVTKYTSVRLRKFGVGVRASDRVIDMVNHNRLLGKVAGTDGLKTGFTNSAGFCLSATAERDGRRVIAVIMGSPASKTRDLQAIDLIERAFSALPAAPATAGLPVPASKSVPTAQPQAMPTVKTDELLAPEQTSTVPADEFKFRLNLPEPKK